MYIVQPMDRGAHSIFHFIAGIKCKLAVVVVFHLIYCAKTEDRPEFIAVFARQKSSGTASAVATQINALGIYIGQGSGIFISADDFESSAYANSVLQPKCLMQSAKMLEQDP